MRSKKALINILTNLLLQVVIIIYGFIVPKIIINKFGSEINGLVTSITQFLAYISLLESGFGPVVKATLYRPIAEKDNKTIAKILKSSEKFFRTIASIFVLYIIILFFVYPLILNTSFDTWLTVSLIAIIGISTFAEYYFGMTYKLFLQAEQKAYVISIIQIITYIICIVAIVLLAIMGANIQMIKLVSGLIFVLRPILQNIYVRKRYNIQLRGVDSDYRIKQKWDGLAQHIAFVIHTNTDIVVLTIFSSLSEVSVYSIYYLVVAGVRKIVQSFSSGIDALFGSIIARKEKENLIKKFSMYEVIFFALTTIVFSCAIVLITPFVSVFTKDVTDVNYIRPLFGVLLAISEFIWSIRQPYNYIIQAAGHFKETRKGAWLECATNVVISVALVNWLGIVGVAIGTIVAMTIRTIEFVYYTNRYILDRSVLESAKKIITIVFEATIIVIICNYLPYLKNANYAYWIINAFMTLGISIIVVFIANILFFKKELKDSVKMIKSVIKRKK